MASGRRCVFCGASEDLNRQHLLPAWLAGVFPNSDEQVMHFRQVGTDPSDRHEWPKKPFRERSRVVCRTCNEGWMARLEDAAKPLLRPAVRHVPCAFDADAQRLAARWALQTCLVLQASQGDVMAPAEHFAWLREHDEPPPQAAVWIASNYRGRDGALGVNYLQKPVSLRSDDARLGDQSDVGYLSFLAVGALAFVVLGHGFSRRTEIEYAGELGHGMLKIWPVAQPVVAWPPRQMMDADFMELLTMEGVGSFETTVWFD